MFKQPLLVIALPKSSSAILQILKQFGYVLKERVEYPYFKLEKGK